MEQMIKQMRITTNMPGDLLFSNINAQTGNKPAPITSANPGAIINIKIPDFADPAVNTFYHAYIANIIEYVKAIRQKDKAKITAAMENDIQFYTKSGHMDDKAESNQAELQKVMDLTKQLQPYITEIMNSEYYNEEGKRLHELPVS